MKPLFTCILLLLTLVLQAQSRIYATVSGGNLFAINPNNCTRILVGSTGQGLGDIAFTTDGRLWGIVSGTLYRIDTATAQTTFVGNYGVGGVSLAGLDDTTLLVESNNKLYGIRTSNATSFYIDTIGYQAAGDLTWYDNDLYMVTAEGKIIKMVLNNTHTALLSVTAVGSDIPTCEAAVTAAFSGGFNAIIGFNGPNLIKICQIDGSYTPLCTNLNLTGTPGAAARRLPVQTPPPVSCLVTSTYTSDQAMVFSLYPNPVRHELHIRMPEYRETTFYLYNTVGQLVKTGRLISEESVLTTDDLGPGVYLLAFHHEAGSSRQYFVVQP